MNWKERFKPSNNTEKVAYIILLALIFLPLFGFSTLYVNSYIPIQYINAVLLLILASYHIFRFVKSRYIISKGKAISVGIAGGLIIFIFSFIFIVFVNSFLRSLPEDTSEGIKNSIAIGSVLITITAISTSIFEKILRLQHVDVD